MGHSFIHFPWRVPQKNSSHPMKHNNFCCWWCSSLPITTLGFWALRGSFTLLRVAVFTCGWLFLFWRTQYVKLPVVTKQTLKPGFSLEVFNTGGMGHFDYSICFVPFSKLGELLNWPKKKTNARCLRLFGTFVGRKMMLCRLCPFFEDGGRWMWWF